MSENKTNFEKWLKERETANAARLEANLTSQGRSPYLRLEQGENTFTLLPVVPTPKTSKWGKEQEVFRVQKDDHEYDWPVTMTSPLYIKIARKMPKAPIDVTVVRVGTGLQTRLNLLEK